MKNSPRASVPLSVRLGATVAALASSLLFAVAPTLADRPAPLEPPAVVAQKAPDSVFAGRTLLLMVDDAGCSWCRKWDREVGVGYGKSEEGKRAPLVRMMRGDKRLKAYPGLGYTPTFLLLVNGEERGRIVGYPGVDFFWGELGRLLQKAPPVPENRASAVSVDRS